MINHWNPFNSSTVASKGFKYLDLSAEMHAVWMHSNIAENDIQKGIQKTESTWVQKVLSRRETKVSSSRSVIPNETAGCFVRTFLVRMPMEECTYVSCCLRLPRPIRISIRHHHLELDIYIVAWFYLTQERRLKCGVCWCHSAYRGAMLAPWIPLPHK